MHDHGQINLAIMKLTVNIPQEGQADWKKVLNYLKDLEMFAANDIHASSRLKAGPPGECSALRVALHRTNGGQL